jgi:hypothetical protein
VVVAGVTTREPEEVADWLPRPWSRETVTAPVVTHERVLETPLVAMERGVAIKEEITGARLLGVTLFDAEEEAEVPAAFLAVTVKVYAWPFVRPVTTMGLPVEEAEILEGFEVAV